MSYTKDEVDAIDQALKSLDKKTRIRGLNRLVDALLVDPKNFRLLRLFNRLHPNDKEYFEFRRELSLTGPEDYPSQSGPEYFQIKRSPQAILEELTRRNWNPVDPADLTEFITRVREWQLMPNGPAKELAAGYAIGWLEERRIDYTATDIRIKHDP